MKKTSKPVVFFGSGPVAAQSLQLLAKDFTIEAVVTKPRPPHHRGSVPVLEVAKTLELPVQTVSTRQELDDFIAKKPFKSRLGILIDFGIIVSQAVIDYFPLGIINSHFSILPEWRGADPITFAVLSGQETTGVSLMLLVEKMDEGPLLAFGEYQLPSHITTPQLTDYLIKLSQALLENTVPGYLEGDIKAAPQTVTGREVSYSRKLTKEDGVIDWNESAELIERQIRAFYGWPGSRTSLGKKDVIILKATVVPMQGVPGEIYTHKGQLVVFAGKNALQIETLKPAGKKEMSAKAFLAGYGRHL